MIADQDTRGAAIKELEKIDIETLQTMQKMMQDHAAAFDRLIEADEKANQEDAERLEIGAHPNTKTYYRFFSRYFTGTWMACQTIASGLVENAEKANLDYVAQGLDIIGNWVPVVTSAVARVFSGLISAWTAIDKKIGVQRISLLFPDLQTAFRDLEMLARQLTLAQKDAILKCGHQSTGFVVSMGKDVQEGLEGKAVEDCKAILTAIKEGKLKPESSVSDLLRVIMGSSFVYERAAVLTAGRASVFLPSSSSSASSSSSSVVPAISSALASPTSLISLADIYKQVCKIETEREKERAEREAERKELQRVKEELRKMKERFPHNIVIAGTSSTQLQISAYKPSNALGQAESTQVSDPAVEDRLKDMGIRTTVQGVRLQEHGDEIADLKARIKQLEKSKK